MKMKKLFFASTLLLCFLFSQHFSLSQNTFSKVYYDDNYRISTMAVEQSSFKEFYYAGVYNDNPVIYKTDSAGSVLLSKTIGVDGCLNRIVIENDSSFLYVGQVLNPGENNANIFCVKADADGDTLWTLEIDMGLNEYGLDIRKAEDNGYYVVGASSWEPYYYGYYEDGQSLWHSKIALAKIDSVGNLEWGELISNNSSTNQSQVIYSILPTNDTGLLAIGYLQDSLPGSCSPSMIIMKIDSNGDIQWSKKHDCISHSYGLGLLQTDSVAICFGQFGWRAGFFGIDSLGTIVWSKDCDGSPYSYGSTNFSKIKQSADGSLVSSSFGGIFNYNPETNLGWQSNFMLNNASDVAACIDNGFIIAGRGPLWLVKYDGQPETGIIKTDSLGIPSSCGEGNSNFTGYDVVRDLVEIPFMTLEAGSEITREKPVEEIGFLERFGCIDIMGERNESTLSENIVHVSPNPSQGIFQIEFVNLLKVESIEIEVFNSMGQKLLIENEENSSIISLDLSSQANGIYYLIVRGKTQIVCEKLIISK